MNGLQDRLQEVFQEVFDEDDLELRREMTANDIEGWDSMTHINLVIAVESTFDVRFATAEISKLKEEGQTVGDFVDVLAAKIAQSA